MPVPQLSFTLQNPNDQGLVQLGNTGVGNPVDVTCILSFSGVFAGAVVAIEGVPIGQPLLQTTLGFGNPPTAASANEWALPFEVNDATGGTVTSPIGPISSLGGTGTCFIYTFTCSYFNLLRARLVSITSGAIQGGIATLPFPLSTSGSPITPPATFLELQRIRFGINCIMVGGADVNWSDLVSGDLN